MTNRLSKHNSPYLQQHAGQPIHWQPWDQQALDQAKDQDRPILLSVGYSTSQACQMMARECFQDPQIALVLNTHFVNIKVDRNERPDLAKIYQTSLQLLTQQGGGWPLTLFLDPKTYLPFFGGNFFPKVSRGQLPGFIDLLMQVNEAFNTQRNDLNEQGEKMRQALDHLVSPAELPALRDAQILAAAREALEGKYDAQDGGFRHSPKLPMQSALERLLRHWAFTRREGGNDKTGLDMVMMSLTKMARGGIYDHLGGGFCRYAMDRQWMIPLFEKALYDNAQLLSLYARILTLGPDALFGKAVEDTVDWLIRDMQAPEGGFYAVMDDTREGANGEYYLWRRTTVKKLLSAEEYSVIETLYGMDKPANLNNRWNLHRYDSWPSVINRLSLAPDEANRLLSQAKQKLFVSRQTRQHPTTDTTVISSWNGLIIKGLADAGSQMGRPDWLDLAQQTADFLRERCWDGQQLLRSWQPDGDNAAGYLDDYAHVLDGLLALLSARWRDEDIKFAQAIAKTMIEQFQDPVNGGFFYTAKTQTNLIFRPKPTLDEALPPGNGIAANALAVLGELIGEPRYVDAANNTLNWARANMARFPDHHCTLLNALENSVFPLEFVILRGPEDEMARWRAALVKGFTPWRHIYAIPYLGVQHLPSYIPRLVTSATQQRVTAYFCSGMECSEPITELDQLRVKLS